jgi:hypothetical protein
MAYDLKDVFYLDGSLQMAQADDTVPLAGEAGSAQIDVSAYVDPIARGKAAGVGLAVYKVHWGIASTSDGSGMLDPTETYAFKAGMVAGAGTGNQAAAALTITSTNSPTVQNALTISAFDFYSPKALVAASAVGVGVPMFSEIVSPSTEVPYIVVRDNICLVYKCKETATEVLYVNFRMECARVKLGADILNQLLRTQTT